MTEPFGDGPRGAAGCGPPQTAWPEEASRDLLAAVLARFLRLGIIAALAAIKHVRIELDVERGKAHDPRRWRAPSARPTCRGQAEQPGRALECSLTP
ncbi:hypothetical protein MFU01_54090 [Myxococcus fulvus]|uniref:Uncharacterized protein n=1 Tax=Myxococcus fulvus TaxID=33 RepID=A0A511TA68_MYXFU|nr:hypothetical protein MFU01_54090 [Myxococcus fulvus]